MPRRDPAIAMIGQAIGAITSLLTQQNLVGFDFRDARLILENAGTAAFFEGYSGTPQRPRSRLPLEMPRLTARP
jgi:cell division GTPase FtsZ